MRQKGLHEKETEKLMEKLVPSSPSNMFELMDCAGKLAQKLDVAERGNKAFCDSWAEDHTYLQDLCRKHGVPEIEIEGDSYGVPTIQCLADSLEKILTDND